MIDGESSHGSKDNRSGSHGHPFPLPLPLSLYPFLFCSLVRFPLYWEPDHLPAQLPRLNSQQKTVERNVGWVCAASQPSNNVMVKLIGSVMMSHLSFFRIEPMFLDNIKTPKLAGCQKATTTTNYKKTHLNLRTSTSFHQQSVHSQNS